MGTTLDNGIYLPDEGERNCYEGLAGNWVALDNHLGSTNIHVTINDKQAWDGHVADTTIHVTSADKQAWNSHVADSVKHVTAEDKNKWNAVTSKANDSDVVHKSGNETVAGFKQFDNIRVNNSIKAINLDSTTTDLNNCYSDFAPYNENKGGNIQYYYCSTDVGTANITNLPEAKAFVLTSITTRLISNSLYVKQILINSNSKTFVRYCNNSTWSTWVNETDSEYVHKSRDETISGNKTFSSINGVEPSSLSLPVAPSSTSYVDISSYITVLDSSVPNTYTPPSNGYITFSVTGNLVQIFHKYGLQGKWSVQAGNVNRGFIPVLGGVEVNIYVNASNIDKFWFIPCQGNV